MAFSKELLLLSLVDTLFIKEVQSDCLSASGVTISLYVTCNLAKTFLHQEHLKCSGQLMLN